MPTKPKAKVGWHAAGIVPRIGLKRDEVQELCEAAGLDPRKRRDPRIGRMVSGVADAIGVYQFERDRSRTAPRPVNQRVAIERLEDAFDTAIAALNDLDDISRERLMSVRPGVDADALQKLRAWSNTATSALHALDGLESRGRVPDDRAVLHELLTHAFAVNAGEDVSVDDFCEFIEIASRIAGAQFTDRDRQRLTAQRLPEKTP